MVIVIRQGMLQIFCSWTQFNLCNLSICLGTQHPFANNQNSFHVCGYKALYLPFIHATEPNNLLWYITFTNAGTKTLA